jgi:hypothetical protein
MDLATLDTSKAASEGAIMEVQHPVEGTVLKDASGQLVTITLIGADSDKVRKRQRIEINKRLKRGNRAKITAEEIEEDSINQLAFSTVAWTGIEFEGKTLDCTADNAAMVYQRLGWLREQVSAFVEDRSNFLKV